MLRQTLAVITALATSGWSMANDADWQARLKRLVRDHTQDKVRPDAVSETPIAGIFEVRSGLDIFYVDASGQYAFVEGHLLDLKSGRDITRERQEAAARINFDALPFDLALKTVRGDGRRRIAVFEDSKCPYCRALRTLVDQLDDITVYTFPFPVLSAESDADARAALCAPDRQAAWSQLVLTGRKAPMSKCDSGVDKLLALGHRLAVRGTPTIFFADGRRAQGAIPPDQFMALLRQAQP